MKINWINALIATLISGLLAWWLWEMGIDTTQKWLLGALGGGVTWIGLLGGMASVFENPRSGSQVKIILYGMASMTFIASCIFSFFEFSAKGYCIPIGVFALLCISSALKIYRTKM